MCRTYNLSNRDQSRKLSNPCHILILSFYSIAFIRGKQSNNSNSLVYDNWTDINLKTSRCLEVKH
jgi:hypothetical protein